MVNKNLNQNEDKDKAKLGMVDEKDVSYASLPIAMSLADYKWQHYGHVLAPVLYRNRYYKLDARSGYYLWMENKNDKLVERKLLRDTQTFLPHEEVRQQLDQVFSNELNDTGLKVHTSHSSHHGDTMHWEIRSDTMKTNIQNSYIGDTDEVYLGAIVRNGIGTNVALGVDLFTYRPICTNGAIARGKDLGSFSISHIRRKDERIQDAIVPAIHEVVSHLKDFTQYYQRATQVKFTQKIMDEITHRLQPSDRMLPKYVEIDLDLRKKKEKNPNNAELQKVPELKVTQYGKSLDMWHVFNDFTDNYWHNSRMSFHRISLQEQNLHRVLINAVEPRQITV